MCKGVNVKEEEKGGWRKMVKERKRKDNRKKRTEKNKIKKEKGEDGGLPRTEKK